MSISHLLRQLLGYLAPYWKIGGLITGGLLLETAFNALVPFSFKFIIDEGLVGGDLHVLRNIVIGLGIGAVLVSLTGLVGDWLYARVIARILGDIRHRMFSHLQALSMDFHARTRAGDVMARFSGDLAVIETALGAAIPWGLLPALNVIASSVLLFVLDWRLALVAMLILPLCLFGPRLFAQRAVQASYERKQDEADALTTVNENIASQLVVKGFGLQRLAMDRFARGNLRLSRSILRLSFFGSLIERSAGIGTLLLQVVVLACGAWMAATGHISIGALASFQALFLSLSYALTYVTQYVPTLVAASGGMQRVDELLETAPGVTDLPGAKSLAPLNRAITLTNLRFGYTPDQPNLRDVSLTIPCGRSVAIVGASGSGKSTVLNLVLRLYDPGQGSVAFDGEDLRQVTEASLREQMGVVFQESFLFDTSFAENIRMGKFDATMPQIEAAARAAEIHDFIVAQPQGYDTPVGERGGRLSGGQRQRVAIARAILRDPRVLLLDEATSALDPQTEAALNATLEAVGRGRTVISVTHRLASIVRADGIFVFDHGRLVESGRHEELLALRGHYHALWMKQSGFSLNAQGDQASVTPERLAAMPIFQELDGELIAEAASHFITEQHPADRLIVREGDPGDRFYIVVRGKLAVFRDAHGGEEKRIAVLHDGDCFGEIALMRREPRSASVRSLSPCTLLSLPRQEFVRLLARAPVFSARLESLYSRRKAELEASSPSP
ncbi:MAG: ABC transporter transmembrane domain-containing protein [Panacagrimonas sp.]